MADKKPGLLKRIFSFGFGKKAKEEEAPALEAPVEELVDTEALAAEAEKAKEQAAQEKADKERIAAEKAEAVKEATKAKAAAEKEAAKIKAAQEKLDAKAKADKEDAKAKAAKEKAESAKAKKQEKADRLAAEEQAAEEEAAKIEAEAAEALRLEELAKAEAAEAQRLEVQAKTEAAEKLATLEAEEASADEIEIVEEPVEAKPTSGEMTVTLTERKEPKAPEPEPAPEEQEERKAGWLKRLTKGLSRSSNALTENITKVFTDKKLDDETMQDLEDILIQADLGVETAMKITDALAAQKFGKTVTDQEVREIMAEEIEKILTPVAVDLDLDLEHQPHVILMIGVNGSGKTTTIGKLSQKLYDAGFSTSLIAGDTFRAAAIEQLKIWGERTQSPVLSRPLGADSAGLAYDAWEMTKEERRDVMLMDTAGRLQNRTELMEELEKIVRVLKKQDPSAPHTVLLTLDATTGQNALNQVEIFKEVAGVNGLVMTKLDGTARGGIMVAIAAKYKLPVYFVGVGEQVEDLEPFEARDFARSIAGLPREEDT